MNKGAMKSNNAYEFKNTFLLLRHGESYANRNGIIVSSPDIGITGYPLTGQGANDVAKLAMHSRMNSDLQIICSDFLRTVQTAEIFAEVLDAKQPQQTPALRERYFGHWDGAAASNYQAVWKNDELGLVENNVETIASVLERNLRCLWELEQSAVGQTFMLVSHGDCLQILLSWFQGLSPRFHRQIIAIKPANLRLLRNTQSLQNIINILNYENDRAA